MLNRPLGDRMKDQYEDRFRYYFPRRTYVILRLDGKAFHSYTKHAHRPFDPRLSAAMQGAGRYLLDQAQGAAFGYHQSDEFSMLLTDFTKIGTEAWFDGCVQKMASVAASLFTAKFNRIIWEAGNTDFPSIAAFDARGFCIPDPVEAQNYFVWRQQDWMRNSVQMLAQSKWSHKELHGKGVRELLDDLKGTDTPWESLTEELRYGSVLLPNSKESLTFDFISTPDVLRKLIPEHGYSSVQP